MTDARNENRRHERLRQPHPDADTANDAVTAFLKAVDRLRDEHGIPDVVVALFARVRDSYGDENEMYASMYFGDPRNKVPLVARTYGQHRRQYDEEVARLVEGRR